LLTLAPMLPLVALAALSAVQLQLTRWLAAR
jgi:hypothetical protein